MPFYEIVLVLKPLPKKELADCLKRVAQKVWAENGVITKLDYLGFKRLPFKARIQNGEDVFSEGSYFIYKASMNSYKVKNIRSELMLDLDLIKARILQSDLERLPKDYQCTLDEESKIPFYRPSVQPLLKDKNVRADVRRLR